MKHGLSITWHRVGITALVVGLVALSSWEGVAAARPTRAADGGSALLAYPAQADTLPAALAVALQRDLQRGYSGHTARWRASTPLSPSATWSQQAKLTASNGAPNDQFGYSVALSGSTALVGAQFKDGGTGAAYVFVRTGTTWSQQAELTARDGASGDHFGFSVALSGATALVGARGKNNLSGAVYVFDRHGTTWIQETELTARNGASNDQFGYSVALSGPTALIGAYYKNRGIGAAYIFARAGTVWSQQAELTARGGAASDFFGISTALNGNTALVGSFGKNSNTGAAYVFGRSGTRWTQQAELLASDGARFDYFGLSVALSASNAVVGAIGKSDSTGAAYVFGHGSTTWTQQAKLTSRDGAAGDFFGASVALSGNSAVIGAPHKNRLIGAAYVFEQSGTFWTQQAKLTASGAAAHEFFGYSVAGDGNTALVGAYLNNRRTGAAYVFVRNGATDLTS